MPLQTRATNFRIEVYAIRSGAGGTVGQGTRYFVNSVLSFLDSPGRFFLASFAIIAAPPSAKACQVPLPVSPPIPLPYGGFALLNDF